MAKFQAASNGAEGPLWTAGMGVLEAMAHKQGAPPTPGPARDLSGHRKLPPQMATNQSEHPGNHAERTKGLKV